MGGRGLPDKGVVSGAGAPGAVGQVPRPTIFDLIILAGGTSVRFGSDKLAEPIGRLSVLARTIEAFTLAGVSEIIVVTSDTSVAELFLNVKFRFAEAGKTRTGSVANALRLATKQYVLIHDGARPFVAKGLIERVIATTEKHGSAVPALPVSDSIRTTENNQIVSFPDRAKFMTVQTPQGFTTARLKEAYGKLSACDTFTDDAEVYAKYICAPNVTEGDPNNRKVTTPADLFGINARVGYGYDIHRLEVGLPLTLCGVKIPHGRGPVAHSDGDIPVHALMDALLSAVGEKDIGHLFPDTDARYKGADSMKLLSDVIAIVWALGYRVLSTAISIIAEKPKLAPYIDDMRKGLAEVLRIAPKDVAITATTAEGTGEIGQEKAIASSAISVVN